MNSENSVSNWKLPLYKIYTDEEDVDLITKVIKRGTNWAIGPEIEEFEKSVRDYVGTDYCVALNSGTSALHATFLAYGFDKKSEIIVPSFSFISTVNSVLFVGSKPVFSDIEETNFGLDPELITEKITSNSRAIVPMDYGGLSCKIFDIKKISKEKNLILIDRNLTNPRGDEFKDPGGYVTISFENDKRMFIDLGDDLGIQPIIEIIGEYGRVIIDDVNDNIVVSCRSHEDMEKPKNLYGLQNKIIKNETFGMGSLKDLIDKMLENLLSSSKILSTAEMAKENVEIYSAIRKSFEINEPVSLPLDDKYYEKEFMVT